MPIEWMQTMYFHTVFSTFLQQAKLHQTLQLAQLRQHCDPVRTRITNQVNRNEMPIANFQRSDLPHLQNHFQLSGDKPQEMHRIDTRIVKSFPYAAPNFVLWVSIIICNPVFRMNGRAYNADQN